MSYSCYISFKTIEAEDICEFFGSLKKECGKYTKELAEKLYTWSPLFNRNVKIEDTDSFFTLSDKYPGIIDAINSWLKDVFTFRWFYLKDFKLLGVFGIPYHKLEDLFDTTIYFQNSTDQNYSFDTWEKIPIFKEISAKWIDKEEEYFADDLKDSVCADLEYYRQTACYQEIWDLLEHYFIDDLSATYISMYRTFDEDFLKFKYMLLRTYREDPKDCIFWGKEEKENE